MRRLICEIQDSGAVTAKFIGGAVTKRELLRLEKAIRLQYRQRVRLHRANLMASQIKQKVEAEKPEEDKKKVGVTQDGNSVT